METEKEIVRKCKNCGSSIWWDEDDIIVDINDLSFCSDECIYEYFSMTQIVEEGYTPREQTVKDFDIKYAGLYDCSTP